VKNYEGKMYLDGKGEMNLSLASSIKYHAMNPMGGGNIILK
jgi:hypothetical protein